MDEYNLLSEMDKLKKEVESLKDQVEFSLMAIKILTLHNRSGFSAPNMSSELRTIDYTLEIDYKKFQELGDKLKKELK